MINAHLLFIIIATICWFLAAYPPWNARVGIGWLGLFFYGLSILIK
jgi:hypothetical protein